MTPATDRHGRGNHARQTIPWSKPASRTARPTIDSCSMRVVACRNGNRHEVVPVCHNEPNGAAIRDGITMTYTRLQAGEVRLLYGATGTELEKRGVPMSTNAWSGSASLDHLDTLEQIHRDHIDAGADIITANTYATSRAARAGWTGRPIRDHQSGGGPRRASGQGSQRPPRGADRRLPLPPRPDRDRLGAAGQRRHRRSRRWPSHSASRRSYCVTRAAT